SLEDPFAAFRLTRIRTWCNLSAVQFSSDRITKTPPADSKRMQYNKSKTPLTRRHFLKTTSVAIGAASLSFPFVGNVLGANDRINVACIGVGGKGDSDSNEVGRCGGNVVALCDVDENTLNKKAQKYTEAKKFRDYRKLFDEMSNDF